jgi:hypothetical protein
MTWPEVTETLSRLDRRAIALVVARSARRLLPLVMLGESDYGPEVAEWHAMMVDVLKLIECYGAGQKVSRYQLNLAADIARGTANTLANKARQYGASAHLHDMELALAAMAFAADAARAETPERVVAAAMQVFKMQSQKWAVEASDLIVDVTATTGPGGRWAFVTSFPELP